MAINSQTECIALSETVHDIMRERMDSGDEMSYHMPILGMFAKQCNIGVEFGVRRCNSTAVLLDSLRGVLHSYDVEAKESHKAIHERLKAAAGAKWRFHLDDSTSANVPDCDLLLHDSLHNYDHVRAELLAHGSKVRKFLAFHDTISHGCIGQSVSCGPKDESVIGIRPAIDEFMIANPWWKIAYSTHAHSGLLILEREQT